MKTISHKKEWRNKIECTKKIFGGGRAELEQKTKNFLRRSGIFLTVFFCALSAILVYTMNLFTENAIDYAGEIYMKGINDVTVKHFDTIITENIYSLRHIVNDVYRNIDDLEEEKRDYILKLAQDDGFGYLAVVDETGKTTNIMGEGFSIENEESFFEAMDRKEKTVRLATTESGENIYVVGLQSDYVNKEGKERHVYVIIGKNVSYLEEALSLEKTEDNVATSSILNRDGKFVARSTFDEYENHFEKMKGCKPTGKYHDINELEENLKDTISKSEEFQCIVEEPDGTKVYLIYSPLEYAGWYLVTGLEYSKMDEGLEKIYGNQIGVVILVFASIVAVMIAIYIRLIRLFSKYVRQLEESRESVIKANRAKMEFLSNVSHDIRTPMNAVQGLTITAKEHIDDREVVEKCLNNILSSSQHMVDLVSDILDMSKMEIEQVKLKEAEFMFSEVVQGVCTVVENMSQSNHKQFYCYVKDIEQEYIFSDRKCIGQIMVNLLSNAVKYTPENGKIELFISQKPSERGEDYVQICIRVKDNGFGMSDEFQQHIFEPFAREDRRRIQKTQGTGLGMAITKNDVDMMGGTIAVQSKIGVGTEFTVCMDVKRARKEKTYGLFGKRILLLDESKAYGSNIEEMLHKMEAETLLCEDINQTVQLLEEAKEKQQPFETVLWNIADNSEEEKERIKEICQTLRGKEMEVVLIVKDWIVWRECMREMGVKKYLEPPIFPVKLYKILKNTEERKASEPLQEQKSETYPPMKLLIAEDNDINWEILEMLMSGKGFDMERAENGRECLEMFTKSEVGNYQMILMDVRMPEMDGYETTQAIRKLDRPDNQIPIIAMTADAFDSDIEKALESGMNDHIAKPIEITLLLKKIENLRTE